MIMILKLFFLFAYFCGMLFLVVLFNVDVGYVSQQ